MKPHRLNSLIDRLGKTRDTIAGLGATMHIRISDEYHRLRIAELELTADYVTRKEVEMRASQAGGAVNRQVRRRAHHPWPARQCRPARPRRRGIEGARRPGHFEAPRPGGP